MKKTLAIVLALVMVLAMIPAMSADVLENKTITDKAYYIAMTNVQTGSEAAQIKVNDKQANTIEYHYNWDKQAADVTGKWTEDTKMAMVFVGGFDPDFTSDAVVYIDGKKIDLDDYPIYSDFAGFVNEGAQAVWFPVELTKSGYTDTYLVQVTESKDGKTITETAKITVKMVNDDTYKGAETATITNIAATKGKVSAYIVGDKIYLDYVEKKGEAELKLTFADENGKAFSAITYAYQPTVTNAICLAEDDTEVKLDKSAALYYVNGETTTDTQFKLETKAANYITKKYDIVVREYIQEEDPKGIYFAETTKTIAMGETFAPVVVGVKTGKPVAATIKAGTNTDAEVIDIENNVVIGTREGVAYITAEYTADNGSKYVSSSMKVIVTLPGESIPAVEPAAEIYYVTCRNLNVRAGAGTSYKKVDMIHRGDAVKVLEIKNGWAKVADGTYVCAKYIAK